MNSNNHPSAYGYQPPSHHGHDSAHPPYGQPRIPEIKLKEMFVQVERKVFAIALKQNERGRFLRLTEEVNGRFTTLIIPITGLEEVHQVLGEMIAANASLPPPPDAPPA